MLRDSLRRLLTGTDPEKVALALDEFGWPDLLGADPAEAVPSLFEIQGETVSASPALNAVLAGPLLSSSGAAAEGEIGPVKPGAGDWTVALPGPGTGRPGAAVVYVVTGGAPLGRCLLVTDREGRAALTVADVPADSAFRTRRVEGVDPWLGLVALEAIGESRVEIVAQGPVVAAAWEEAVIAGRRALAHELIGLSRAMLALAVEHARERHQFGQPVGAFQAVKHRLAEAKVALTAAEAAAAEAWADPGALTALLAKLWAGRAARLVGKQAQQVLGGMGFTWEHPFHRHARRALVLDGLLGSTTELQHELGRSLLAGHGDVPRLARL